MKKALITMVGLWIILILPTHSHAGKKFLFTPFLDLSYDLGEEYADNNIDYTTDGVNFTFGINLYHDPLNLQLQAGNHLYSITHSGDFCGIARIGLISEIVKNGFAEMNVSYTQNFTRLQNYFPYSYSGSIGYRHLFNIINGSKPVALSLGNNFGFIIKQHLGHKTNLFSVMEVACHANYLNPYFAFGLTRFSDQDESIRYSPFLSIGIQAQFVSTAPYFSGNQTKLTYYKEKSPIIHMVRKPNIYLYPESKIQAKIYLIPKKGNEIIASIPDYKTGWDVSVEPSGLIDSKYDYLFYEGSGINFKPSRIGWSVGQNELWQFILKTMEEYGFNEKEIKDFVEYWQEHLPKSPYYNIIPLTAQEIEKEFSLIVEPEPAAVLRVWFHINPTNEKNNFKSPKINQFERKGFAVIEWGVILE